MKNRFLAFLTLILCFLPCTSYSLLQIGFKSEFGQGGSGPGQMNEPADIAIDADGTIYLADKSNRRVTVMTNDGKFLASWQSRDGDKWQMSAPSGIGISENRIYISDSDKDKVLVFSRDGSFLDEFGGSGSAPKQFDNPKGIAVNRGVIYVADTGNHRVQVFSSDGIYLQSIGEKGDRDGQMRSPLDVAVDHNGSIYVADSGNNRIQVFSPSGEHLKNYHDLSMPVSICTDKDGFYVADAGNFRIKRLAFDGRLLLSFGTKGEGPAQFRDLSGISLDQSGDLFIADAAKNTIQRFSPEQIKGNPPEFSPPLNSVKWLGEVSVIATDMAWHKNVLYATNQKDDSVIVIQDGLVRKVIMGQGNDLMDNPWGISVDPEGFIWVVDSGNNRLIRMNTDGKIQSVIGGPGKREGYFSSPKGIYISQKGIMYIADSGNERVQIFNTDGVYMNKIEKFSEEGFENPVDIDADTAGNVFVVDEDAHAVYKFNPEGKYLLTIGKKGEGNGEFRNPKGVLVTDNEIMVLDSGNQRIQVFDHRGAFLRKFGAKGKSKGDFLDPFALVLRDDVTISVADTGNERIQEIGLSYTPRTPLNLKAESGIREITLSWPKGMDKYVGAYNVYRSTDKKPYSLIASPSKTSFTDKEVKPGKAYSYRISAVAKNGNEGARSEPVEAVAKKLILLQPDDIRITAGETEIALAWQADSEGTADVYSISREEDGKFREIARTRDNSFKDTGLKTDTTYLYRIISVSPGGEESFPATVSAATTKKSVTPPAPPAHIKVTPGETEITFNWQVNQNSAIDSHAVYREVEGVFRELARVKGDIYTDAGLKPDTMYTYKIASVSRDGAESEGVPVRVSTNKRFIKPPSGIRISAGPDEVVISWQNEKAANIDACIIYKEIDGAFKEIGRIKGESFSDRGLKIDNTYIYKISALAPDGAESEGVLLKATTKRKVLVPPANITATPDDTEVILAWKPDKDPYITTYVIYRAIDGTLQEVGRVRSDSYTDAGLKPNTPYVYKITSVNTEGEESYGAIVKTSTIQRQPDIEVTVIKSRDIFSNAYKVYEKEGIGRIRIQNISNRVLTGAAVSFMIKEYMNSPYETGAGDILPGAGTEIDLKPVLNEKVLATREKTSLKSEVKVLYTVDGKTKHVTIPHTVMIAVAERNYNPADEKLFLAALKSFDKMSIKKPEQEVIRKIKESLSVDEGLIRSLRDKELSFGECVTCLYLFKYKGKPLDDILILRSGGQSWQEIVGFYNVYHDDVADVLKDIEEGISKKKAKKK